MAAVMHDSMRITCICHGTRSGGVMDYLHKKLDLQANDVVAVVLDHAANVQLLDPANFESYRSQQPYRYHGGYATKSPFRIRAPHDGVWHLVIDLGGAAGAVRASVQILSEISAA